MANGRSSEASTAGTQSSRSALKSTRSQPSACRFASAEASSMLATLAGSRARICSAVAWIRSVT